MRFISSYIDSSPFFLSEIIVFAKKKFGFSNLDLVVEIGMTMKIVT